MGWLRNRPAATWFVTFMPPIGPECELRRSEILAACDGYMADRQVVAISTGHAGASEASDTAAALVCDLAVEIARVRPRTLPGLRALAVWFGGRVEADDVHDDSLDLFARTVSVFGVAA